MFDRRDFLAQAVAAGGVVSLSHYVPPFLMASAAEPALRHQENILVVLQLSGGNDGLNTVIPYGNDGYYRNRFTLAIPKSQVLKIDDYVGFHPALGGFADLLQEQRLAIVQGVGYPNPNRSHFESMDLWHTAHRSVAARQSGWLGRAIEQNFGDATMPALHWGNDPQPLALASPDFPVPSIRSLDAFQRASRDIAQAGVLETSLDAAAGQSPLVEFVKQSTRLAEKTNDLLQTAAANPASGFPGTELGQKLAAVAQLIRAELGTRIYYVTLDGFDTHANQQPVHAALLGQLGDALHAFITALHEHRLDSRVAVLVFSEFGRRVRENASAGTDHGTAAPVFIAGGKVRSGCFNKHPSLDQLPEGDLQFEIDYRRLYATILERWLGCDPRGVVGEGFAPIDVWA
jgi:uncharacterized protein (DUF1501 family)